MTSTALEMLPANGDPNSWTEQETALMEAIGVRGTRNVQRNGSWVKEPFQAPRATVEAFLAQCRRTRLDPVARQIYCIERGGKWGIQASIDGFRLIAEWSKEYRGQTPVQWTGDGVTWVDVWLDESRPPAAARVGIYRDGFVEPLWAVATYAGYVPKKKDGTPDPTGQWKTNPSNQLAKCAEMLGLRKAFPQDLSGLYGTEEMDQATVSSGRAAPEPAAHVEATQQPAAEPSFAKVNWAARIVDATSVDELRQVHADASKAGELGMFIDPKFQTHIDGMLSLFGLPKPDGYVLVGDAIRVVKPVLERLAAEDVVDAEVVEDEPAQIDERDPSAGMSWPTVEPGSGGRTADPDSGVEFR